jgi:NADP-dependent 3-hydroxy acid dehydrogenase YdfG
MWRILVPMPQPRPKYSERAVLITGCSSGIGKAVAGAFLRAGFATFATARNIADIEDLRTAGCETLKLDVTDDESMRAAVAAVEARFGAVAVLVNNAGYPVHGPIEEIDIVAVRKEFETNVIGLIRMTQLVLPGMRRAGDGRVINLGSTAGRVILPGAGAYHASKFAVEAIAATLRPEVAPFGIKVVNIMPGPVQTRFQEKMFASIPKSGADDPYLRFKERLRQLMQRTMTDGSSLSVSADDVAKVILKAATATHPRPAYAPGLAAKAILLFVPLVPTRLRDRAYRHILWG